MCTFFFSFFFLLFFSGKIYKPHTSLQSLNTKSVHCETWCDNYPCNFMNVAIFKPVCMLVPYIVEAIAAPVFYVWNQLQLSGQFIVLVKYGIEFQDLSFHFNNIFDELNLTGVISTSGREMSMGASKGLTND